MRLFAQLKWYFLSEWRRYTGAVTFLIIIAVLQILPPRFVGIIVDGVTKETMTTTTLWVWVGVMLLIALVIYILRYIWRV